MALKVPFQFVSDLTASARQQLHRNFAEVERWANATIAQPATTFPANPSAGQLFYETVTDKLWAYNGTAWVLQVASGEWATWTPAFTQGGAVSGSTVQARWTRAGRLITAQFRRDVTSSGTAGNAVTVAPPAAAYLASSAAVPAGSGWLFDASAGRMYEGTWDALSGGTAMDFVTDETGADAWGVNPSIALANGDVIAGQLCYEAAAST